MKYTLIQLIIFTFILPISLHAVTITRTEETPYTIRLISHKEKRTVKTGSTPDFLFFGNGVRISEIAEDSPAIKAGMQTGDIIVQVDDMKVTGMKEYSMVLEHYDPGDEATFIYIRDDKEQTTRITFIAR